jgi:hypothetical protein
MQIWPIFQEFYNGGQNCFTLTQNLPARVDFDENEAIITYRTGRTLTISREEIEKEWAILESKGQLTDNEVVNITQLIGPSKNKYPAPCWKDRTDRGMAIIAMLQDWGVHPHGRPNCRMLTLNREQFLKKLKEFIPKNMPSK